MLTLFTVLFIVPSVDTTFCLSLYSVFCLHFLLTDPDVSGLNRTSKLCLLEERESIFFPQRFQNHCL